jgi:tripeptide aminopeptidase
MLNAGVERTSVKLLVRDFVTASLAYLEQMVASYAAEAVAAFPGSRMEIEVEESYRNMKEVLDHHPEVVNNAREAIERAGLDARIEPIRGGTDGSRLSFMGLPTCTKPWK